MQADTTILNGGGTQLMKHYLPNLFHYLTENEFQELLNQLYQHSLRSDSPITVRGFGSSFFKLIEELRTNEGNQVKNEFKYFNYLLGEFLKFGNHKEFKNLLRGHLFNLKVNNFHHALGEVAICLELVQMSQLIKYEFPLPNGNNADFEFSLNEDCSVYIDVYTIDYKKSKYEKQNFEKFLDKRIFDKYHSKTQGLSQELKRKIYVYPILSGFSPEIIKEQGDYLYDICNSSLERNNYQSFSPKAFGNIQGTFFNLFSLEEIMNPDLIIAKYGK